MMWNNGICPFLNSGALGTWGWIGMVLSILVWVSLIAGLAYLAVWFVRRAGSNFQASTAYATPASAREIAQMRYARGEIGREEYLNLLEDLR